jgi:hypothetical protein
MCRFFASRAGTGAQIVGTAATLAGSAAGRPECRPKAGPESVRFSGWQPVDFVVV